MNTKKTKRSPFLPRLRAFLRKGEEGWTFLEVVMVIGIILILISSVAFMVPRFIQKAREVGARNSIAAMSLALTAFELDCGNYPSEDAGLEALWTRPDDEDRWDGPYIDKPVGNDPWGNEYVYRVPGPNGLDFEIVSFGADGVEGGEGRDADISSANSD